MEKNENGGSRERVSNFSLEIRTIRPSAVFGPRRKNVLRVAGYAWTPKSWSFDKLQEVGVSPYLSFIPILSILRMFELNEAVRGRLIGPKLGTKLLEIFLGFFLPSVTVQKI